MSEDPSIEDEAERKAALRAQVATAGEDAAAVFAADKISKTRELRKRARRGRFDRRDRAKLDHYEASLDLLSVALPGQRPCRVAAHRARAGGAAARRALSGQPAAISSTPSRRARPSPPQRMTTLWL